MHPIQVPKELVNDTEYLVLALQAEPGQYVRTGQPLAELESSKATFHLFSPADGHFRPEYKAGDMVPVGAVFGLVDESPLEQPEPGEPSAVKTEADPRFSRAAWELYSASEVSMDRFAGMTHIRRADVEKALAVPGAETSDPGALVLLGGGGHCRECIEAIERAGKYRIHGIIDTNAKPGTMIAGYPVLGDNARLEGLRRDGITHLVLAYGIAGGQAERGAHFRRLAELGHNFPAIIHPKAAVNTHARIGAGVQIMAGALIGSEAQLGDACLINSNAVVSHDCRLGSNVHIAPGAILAGGVRVGDDTVVGMGATVYMRASIGKDVVIYNGATIFADVPDGVVVQGCWPEPSRSG